MVKSVRGRKRFYKIVFKNVKNYNQVLKSKLHYTKKKKLTHITLQYLSFSFCVSYSKKKKSQQKNHGT